MKTILTNMTVLALLMGISGCLFPFRDWQGERRYQRDDRYERGHGHQSGRDCWSRDGQVYCRN